LTYFADDLIMESFYFVGIGIMAKIHSGFFAWFDINHISQ